MYIIDITDPPAPAINIRITSSLNNTEENIAIVSLEWDYFSDGSPVNYSVTVIGSSENDTVSALTAEMRVELKLRYNTEYAVIVEVINCAVSSSSSMFTFELGNQDAFRLILRPSCCVCFIGLGRIEAKVSSIMIMLITMTFQSDVRFPLLPQTGCLKVLVRQRAKHSL